VFLSLKSSILLSLGWWIFILIAFSNAATDLFVVMAVLFIAMCWGVALLIRVVLTIGSHMSPEMRARSELRISWSWAIETFTLFGSFCLISLHIPFILRIKLSEPDLAAYIRAVNDPKLTDRVTKYPSRRVGLFQIKETERLDGGIVRMITTDAFLDDAGFVYSPNRQPPIRGEDSYRHLYGDWWYWHRSW
jgi:hypothetical protein